MRFPETSQKDRLRDRFRKILDEQHVMLPGMEGKSRGEQLTIRNLLADQLATAGLEEMVAPVVGDVG